MDDNHHKLLSRIVKKFGETKKNAAKKVQVPEVTVLKYLNLVGVQQWPEPNYMKKRGLTKQPTSIDEVLNIDQQHIEKKTRLDESSADKERCPQKVDEVVILKAEDWHRDIKRFRYSMLVSFNTVVTRITRYFNLETGSYRLKYFNVDGDKVMLTSEEDMQECITCTKSVGVNVHIHVFFL